MPLNKETETVTINLISKIFNCLLQLKSNSKQSFWWFVLGFLCFFYCISTFVSYTTMAFELNKNIVQSAGAVEYADCIFAEEVGPFLPHPCITSILDMTLSRLINKIISVRWQDLKPFNCVQIKLLVLGNYTWNNFYVNKWALARLKVVNYKLFVYK